MQNSKTETEAPEKVNQVYQGEFMREGRSFWDILFFSYAKPLMDSARTQKIYFEQYGKLPDRLLIKNEEERIEASIQKYIAKDPMDRLAFMKGLLDANKYDLAKFFAVRCTLTM